MEYRRKRRTKGRIKCSANRRGSSAGRAVSVLVPIMVFTAAFILIGKIGKDRLGSIINDNFGVFDSCTGNAKERYADITEPVYPTVSAGNVVAPAETTAPASKESVKVSLPKLDIYMLQMGVYSSYENSAEQAEAIKKAGAAGFIFDDNGSYRVIAAAFSSEDKANSVCERLNAEGRKCTVFHYSCSGAELLITADKSRIDEIEYAFSNTSDLLDSLNGSIAELEAATDGEDYVIACLTALQVQTAEAIADLQEVAELNDILMDVYLFNRDAGDMLSGMIVSEPKGSGFSSSLRLMQLKICMRYVSLLKKING